MYSFKSRNLKRQKNAIRQKRVQRGHAFFVAFCEKNKMLDDLLINYDPCERRMGSVIEMQFIPRAAIVTMGIPSDLNFTGPLILQPGWRWYTLELQDQTSFFNEDFRDTPNGELYDISVGGFFPRDDIAALQLLTRMARYYYLVRARDINGRWRLIGNLNETLKLKKRTYSNTTSETQVGFMLEFSASFLRPALFDNHS